MSFAEVFPASCAEFDGEYYDSQTEAAWAAYLTEHGVEFQHEPATYKLPAGQLYTPDFFLPEMDAYIEAKNGNADNLAAYKLSLLTYATGRQGFIVDGKPHYATVYAYTPEWTLKPSTGSRLQYDHRLTRGISPLDKKENIWIPDYDAEPELSGLELKAAKRVIEASTKLPTEAMAAEHAEKKKRMRLPENIIDLSYVPIPNGSLHY